jgi:hypothetical protein
VVGKGGVTRVGNALLDIVKPLIEFGIPDASNVVKLLIDSDFHGIKDILDMPSENRVVIAFSFEDDAKRNAF